MTSLRFILLALLWSLSAVGLVVAQEAAATVPGLAGEPELSAAFASSRGSVGEVVQLQVEATFDDAAWRALVPELHHGPEFLRQNVAQSSRRVSRQQVVRYVFDLVPLAAGELSPGYVEWPFESAGEERTLQVEVPAFVAVAASEKGNGRLLLAALVLVAIAALGLVVAARSRGSNAHEDPRLLEFEERLQAARRAIGAGEKSALDQLASLRHDTVDLATAGEIGAADEGTLKAVLERVLYGGLSVSDPEVTGLIDQVERQLEVRLRAYRERSGRGVRRAGRQ